MITILFIVYNLFNSTDKSTSSFRYFINSDSSTQDKIMYNKYSERLLLFTANNIFQFKTSVINTYVVLFCFYHKETLTLITSVTGNEGNN